MFYFTINKEFSVFWFYNESSNMMAFNFSLANALMNLINLEITDHLAWIVILISGKAPLKSSISS